MSKKLSADSRNDWFRLLHSSVESEASVPNQTSDDLEAVVSSEEDVKGDVGSLKQQLF